MIIDTHMHLASPDLTTYPPLQHQPGAQSSSAFRWFGAATGESTADASVAALRARMAAAVPPVQKAFNITPGWYGSG
jgi:hypothetical protein